MPLFKTNRDFDSTLIICGIHLLLAAILYIEVRGQHTADITSIMNNLLIIYGMICSYFFKAQTESKANGDPNQK